MKRWLAHLFIGSYLFALGTGVVCHSFGFGQAVHPGMYYIIWDMFCGWSHYESHMQIIAQGESGAYYELSPPPWGDFCPYGPLGRRHYDSFAAHGIRLGMNTLNHTKHEPITKIFLVEQMHAKKFNLSDEDYEARYGEPKDPKTYSHIRVVADANGQVQFAQREWLTYQHDLCITDNPRLLADSRRSKPFFISTADRSAPAPVTIGGTLDTRRSISSGSPLGN